MGITVMFSLNNSKVPMEPHLILSVTYRQGKYFITLPFHFQLFMLISSYQEA